MSPAKQSKPDARNRIPQYFDRPVSAAGTKGRPTNRIAKMDDESSPVEGNRPKGNRRVSSRWDGAQSIPKERIEELHQHDRTPTQKMVIDTVLLIATSIASVVAWQQGYFLIVVAMWVAGGFLAHIKPLAFHDAAHGTLHPSPRINELLGVGIATTILVPLSLYRYAHARHHAHIATERDPELWPFTITTIPKWVRQLTAFFEIVLGFVATPVLFLRAFLTATDIAPKLRRRIKLEYAASIALWGALILVVAVTGMWTAFAVGVVVPWAVAGMFQTFNKYVEHMGLTGVGVMASSRSVVPRDKLGEAFSSAWQNVAHHGTHHLYAKIPHYSLPDATPLVTGDNPPAGSVFPTYTAAALAMLKTLNDPRIGPQWNSAMTGE